MRMTVAARRELARKVSDVLDSAFPEAQCTLDNDLPERLAIRGILSAQCTDERVNITARDLFDMYPSMEDIAEAGEEAIGEVIRPCGLYRSKARAVVTFAGLFTGPWEHRVPDDIGTLMTCPGIGRKIANLIVGEVYGIPAMVVDTHCKRVMKRIGITNETDPNKVEADVCKVFDEDKWISLGHKSVMLGRTYCRAASPLCDSCPLGGTCLRRI